MKTTLRELNRSLSKISYRRHMMNEKLNYFFEDFSAGVVVDLGGTNVTGKKYFSYPKHKAQKWITINISEEAMPDIIGSIYETGIETSSVDAIICTEVFEHLADPFAAMKEVERILKPGGIFIGSTPFLFKIHGDPDDYFRYTKSALENVLLKNFSKIELYPMGGGIGTAGMILTQVSDDFYYRILKYIVIYSARLMELADYRMGHERKAALTTGYIWKCTF